MTVNVPVPPSGGDGFPAGLPSNRVTRGTPARGDEIKGWTDRDGLPLPDTMLVVGYTTILRRWKDKKPEDKTEHPLPDPAELNAAIPVKEWQIGLDGKPQEPWKLTYVVYHPIDWRAPGGSQLVPQAPTPQISGPTASTPPTSTPPTTPATPSSTPSTPTTPPPAAAASAQSSSALLDHMKSVKPVTVGELIADELPPWA